MAVGAPGRLPREPRPGLRPIPDFLILGAAKCGTTTLYNDLARHPDIFMSEPKEPFFFENEYEMGLAYYRDTYFSGYGGQAVAGEARVANLFLPFVPERIKTSLPHAKLIAILRNPVDRAFSHWWMKYCGGHERASFDQAIRSNLERLERGENLEGEAGERLWRSRVRAGNPAHVDLPVYVDAGYYALQLKRYFRLFPEGQIKLLYFEQLRTEPLGMYGELCSFLGVDEAESPRRLSHERASLSSASIPFLKLDRILNISPRLPPALRSNIRAVLNRFGNRPAMSAATREMLIEHYYPHNRDLERLMGRSFSGWNQ